MINKVVQISTIDATRIKEQSVEITEIHAGFSRRLNYLIDCSEVEAPSLSDGRVSYIANMLKVSRPAVTDWLTKNKPPKEVTLFEIARTFLKYMDLGEDILPARVVSWLRYGDEVSPCPFKLDYEVDVNQSLMPLAASIIANEAKVLGLGASSYDLEAVLNSTTKTLLDFELNEVEDIKEVHLKIIRQLIKTNLR